MKLFTLSIVAFFCFLGLTQAGPLFGRRGGSCANGSCGAATFQAVYAAPPVQTSTLKQTGVIAAPVQGCAGVGCAGQAAGCAGASGCSGAASGCSGIESKGRFHILPWRR